MVSVSAGIISNFVCSHCGVKSQFTVRVFDTDTIKNVYYEISQCNNNDCLKLMLFVYKISGFKTRSVNYKKIFHYPTSKITVHPSVSTNIAESYSEGVQCMDIGAHKGAVLLFRRALQEVCENRGADINKKLNQQIDEIIPSDLSEMAHEIRQWGNIGAHPDEIIINVQPGDSIEMKNLLDLLFQYLYEMPWKVSQSRNKRQGNTS